ncbi:hypothetical protein [Amycolatopsis benzoatilytica]|uniref:hypothetical protein n=1 Tax=Amycolatopsis benzoatilytica TaxID=346045 RepID=UPI00036EBD40|nr:hypothetical protein [Amycolatopsis benzoatilytica]
MSSKTRISARTRLAAGTVAAAAAVIAGGTLGIAAASASPAVPAVSAVSAASATAGTPAGLAATPKPPAGARAVVKVAPNPATPGGEVTITGNCGGGKGLKAVLGGFPDNPALTDVQIVDAGPDKFEAKAKVSPTIGDGVGPVLVDCDGEAGVTLMVTHTQPGNG